MAGVSLAVWTAGCNRHQSTLAPFGEDAFDVRSLLLVMTLAAAAIAVGVFALMAIAPRAREGRLSHQGGMRMILWLGAIVPTVVLTALLLYALPMMRPRDVRPADLTIAVEGEQFWWRVAYALPGGERVVSANEVRVPVGRTVAFALTGGDIVHSFWIPGLAGKMDMIPGRTNDLVVRATKPGRYRGVCTEFCGLSHALMAFDVVAMEPAAFDAWLAAEARPARPSAPEGARAFAAAGCGACHSVRGTGEGGTIGPDLTHFGARASIGAGTLPATPANIARFVRDAGAVKPGARMPAFTHLSRAETLAITRYLEGLE